MKKIFILTGEPSGDKLASKVINHLKKINQNVDYLSVGGEHLKSLGIETIYDLKVDSKEEKFKPKNKLIKVSKNEMPKYINDNIDKFKDWID